MSANSIDTSTSTSNCKNSSDGCIKHKDMGHQQGNEMCSCACPGYGKVCPCTIILAERDAAHATASLYQDSQTLFHPQPPMFHVYRRDQLLIGEKLGAGGFCQVHQVTVKGEPSLVGTKGETSRYAIKFLKKTTMVNKKSFVQGATDLAVEANFLAALGARNPEHKHVVQLRGIADGLIENSENTLGMERTLFLIMDQLSETLEHRIQRWKEEVAPTSGIRNAVTRTSGNFQRRRLEKLRGEQLSVGLQVAEAMQYLHSFNLIFRDLKPENVGFDESGTVKLYDFGLAKELKDSQKDKDGNYKMTGGAGSVRYMAPEVVLCRPYNASVDVYSFGILLCEVASLVKAFQGCDANDHMDKVVEGGQRPRVEYWFPEALDTLLKVCWAPDATERPSFDEVVESLKTIIEAEPEQQEASTFKTLSDLSREIFR